VTTRERSAAREEGRGILALGHGGVFWSYGDKIDNVKPVNGWMVKMDCSAIFERKFKFLSAKYEKLICFSAK